MVWKLHLLGGRAVGRMLCWGIDAVEKLVTVVKTQEAFSSVILLLLSVKSKIGMQPVGSDAQKMSFLGSLRRRPYSHVSHS